MTRRVLVTAGGAGIGRAMAEAFAAEGATVWITDVDRDRLDACPDAWRKTPADAVDEPATAALFAEIRRAWGGLDALCANAGTAGPTAPVEAVALEDWRACVSVSLEGAFLAAKHAAPIMRDQGGGALIFTSSIAGLFGYPNRAPYAAAKWGMIGLMKTAAMELGPYGVRANAICPGAVEGERIERVLDGAAAARGITLDEIRARYARGSSMRRFVEAADVAELAVFLASDAARTVSGQVIAVDGHTESPPSAA